MTITFQDRIDAGESLAGRLLDLRDRDDVIVLGLPRGGVPVAAEVARAIHAPLDILLVRKIGVPQQPELAMGAIASGDNLVLDDGLIAALSVSESEVQATIRRERAVLRDREQRYRGDRPLPDLRNKIVVIVDDGLATGATMRVAIQAVKQSRPAQIVVGVPVGSPDRVRAISREVDRVECVSTPRGFSAVGQWYRDFRPTTDAEVIEILAEQTGGMQS